MQQWADKLDAFLAFNEHDILDGAGKVSHEAAKKLAEAQYDSFTEQRRITAAKDISDFDAFVEKTKDVG